MADDSTLSVTFTELLYSVVVANALTKLTFDPTLRNGMILFAVLVVLSDWVEYRAFLGVLDEDASQVAVFVADVLVLLIWNTTTIIPSNEFVWYIAVMALFFASQNVWEFLSGRYGALEVLITPTTAIVVGYTALAGVIYAGRISPGAAFVIAVVLFVVGKTPAWMRIREMSQTVRL